LEIQQNYVTIFIYLSLGQRFVHFSFFLLLEYNQAVAIMPYYIDE